MGPLRGRRRRAAAVRLALQRFLDAALTCDAANEASLAAGRHPTHTGKAGRGCAVKTTLKTWRYPLSYLQCISCRPRSHLARVRRFRPDNFFFGTSIFGCLFINPKSTGTGSNMRTTAGTGLFGRLCRRKISEGLRNRKPFGKASLLQTSGHEGRASCVAVQPARRVNRLIRKQSPNTLETA